MKIAHHHSSKMLEQEGKPLPGANPESFYWWNDALDTLDSTAGATGSKVKARYSFVYVFEVSEWKIAHHHSSSMPELKLALKITEKEAQSLFHLSNDAFTMLNPAMVAMRYAKNAVLLPTVSDTPRTDYASIKNYFESFLQKKPQNTILESHVTLGEGWSKDVGIYEFTMGAPSDKVKGWYTFVYVYKDGEWKISHHNSSVMPEAYL